MIVPPELNNPTSGNILICGRDPGRTEVRQGRPFVGRAGHILDECLSLARIRRKDCNLANVVGVKPPGNEFRAHQGRDIEEGLQSLYELVERLEPSVIVTLGNEAAWAMVEGWPDRGRGIRGANGIEDRRGYVWTTTRAVSPVVTAIHPAAADRVWVPWATLFRQVRH